MEKTNIMYKDAKLYKKLPEGIKEVNSQITYKRLLKITFKGFLINWLITDL